MFRNFLRDALEIFFHQPEITEQFARGGQHQGKAFIDLDGSVNGHGTGGSDAVDFLLDAGGIGLELLDTDIDVGGGVPKDVVEAGENAFQPAFRADEPAGSLQLLHPQEGFFRTGGQFKDRLRRVFNVIFPQKPVSVITPDSQILGGGHGVALGVGVAQVFQIGVQQSTELTFRQRGPVLGFKGVRKKPQHHRGILTAQQPRCRMIQQNCYFLIRHMIDHVF
jgi:hypothetical protein